MHYDRREDRARFDEQKAGKQAQNKGIEDLPVVHVVHSKEQRRGEYCELLTQHLVVSQNRAPEHQLLKNRREDRYGKHRCEHAQRTVAAEIQFNFGQLDPGYFIEQKLK